MHSIIQGSYPIKGLHLALEALELLKNEYPDVKLYVAGSDIIHYNGIKQIIRKTYYAKYIITWIFISGGCFIYVRLLYQSNI